MHVRLLPNKRTEILRFHYYINLMHVRLLPYKRNEILLSFNIFKLTMRRGDSFAFGKIKKNLLFIE